MLEFFNISKIFNFLEYGQGILKRSIFEYL